MRCKHRSDAKDNRRKPRKHMQAKKAVLTYYDRRAPNLQGAVLGEQFYCTTIFFLYLVYSCICVFALFLIPAPKAN